MNDYIDFSALWQVAALSLAFVAGFVGLYSFGIAAGATTGSGPAGLGRRAITVACFTACLGIVGFGIWVMLQK